MSTTAPVTWQDYADLWSSDPKYKAQFDVIKPTLDALGIKPANKGDIRDSSYSAQAPYDSTSYDSGYDSGYESDYGSAHIPYGTTPDDYDYIGDDDAYFPPATPGSHGTGSTGSGSGAVPPGFSTAPQTVPLTDQETKERADKWVAQLQKDLGITKEQAVGMVANLCHESWGLNTGIKQGGQIGQPGELNNGVNQSGYGLCQWGESREAALVAYAKQHNLPPSSEAAAYGFFLQEANGTHKPAIDAVRGTKTADEALQVFCSKFLIPSDPRLHERRQWLSSDGEITVPEVRPRAFV